MADYEDMYEDTGWKSTPYLDDDGMVCEYWEPVEPDEEEYYENENRTYVDPMDISDAEPPSYEDD